ncbi:MAG: hypothetical protein LLG04_06545 [Parachlamydia sp.]|nr:hypothetical protein [Parachlamydia sp.]
MKQQTISSRIKTETALEIQFLKKELGINQTSIIESAIHHLYQETKQKKKQSRYELFKKSGFIGAIKAEPDLSVNYKKKFADYLSEKYAQK